MPINLQPIAIQYTPDSQLIEGRAIISLSLDFSTNPNQVIDLTSIRSTRPFSGVKGIYIEFESGGQTVPLTVSVQSTGIVFNLDTTSHSCNYLPVDTVPSDRIFLSVPPGTTAKANIVMTNFKMKPLRYRVN